MPTTQNRDYGPRLAGLRVWAWGLALCLIAGCKQLDPVQKDDLCATGPVPVSANCEQCKTPPYRAECPQCQMSNPDPAVCLPPTASMEGPLTGSAGEETATGGAGESGGEGATPGTMTGMRSGMNNNGGSAPSMVMAGRPAPPATPANSGGSGGNVPASHAGQSGSGLPPGACATDPDCKDPAMPACRTDQQTCVPCLSKAHCAMGLTCDASKFRCVQCVVPTDCPMGSTCNLAEQTCVQCVGDNNCTDTTLGTCNTKHTCVDCVMEGNSGCTLDRPVCLNEGCVECMVNQDCANGTKGTKLACAEVQHVCVECNGDPDCRSTTGKPACELTTNTCVECLSDSQCGSATAARCDSEHTCSPCTEDSQCKHLPDTQRCDTGTGACVPCLEDTDCGRGTCVRSTHMCSTTSPGTISLCNACETTTQCGASQRCVVVDSSDGTPFCVSRPSSRGSCTRPYHSSSKTSVDGESGTVCLPPTTTNCEVLLAVNKDCQACPVGGLCSVTPSGSYCTYACSASNGDSDCPAGSTCNSGTCSVNP